MGNLVKETTSSGSGAQKSTSKFHTDEDVPKSLDGVVSMIGCSSLMNCCCNQQPFQNIRQILYHKVGYSLKKLFQSEKFHKNENALWRFRGDNAVTLLFQIVVQIRPAKHKHANKVLFTSEAKKPILHRL